MQLDKDSQKLTAFTIPGKGQFHWITSPMGLLGCPASFQRLMEGLLRDIPNVLVYIDNLLVHTDTGSGTGMATQKSPQNQPGEMHIRQQESLVPGLHSHSRRDQTRQE
jgi:hypothetical protein